MGVVYLFCDFVNDYLVLGEFIKVLLEYIIIGFYLWVVYLLCNF